MKVLEAYIEPEFMRWTRKFPDEFFQQVYKLHGWNFKAGSTKRPQCVGHFINEFIYEPMPPGVLDELRRKNPVTESGYRRHKHTQFLTVHTGHEHLDKQITAVTTIMRISDSKKEFKTLFLKAYPPRVAEERKPLVNDVSKVNPSREANLFSHQEPEPPSDSTAPAPPS